MLLGSRSVSVYSRLGKKVTLAVLAAVIITAIISACIQIKIELQRDIGEVQDKLELIDADFIASVSDAVWQVDKPRITFLLKILTG